MYANVCQILKVLEQVLLDGGAWDLAWTWTGLEDPCGHDSLRRAPAHPAEYQAAIGALKAAKSLTEFRKTLHKLNFEAKGAGKGKKVDEPI